MWFDMQRGSLEWASEAPLTFHNETILDATCDEVFDILADVDQWSDWFEEFEGAEWITLGSPDVGSERVVHLDIMDAREEFLAWEPGRRFSFCLKSATLPLANWLVEDYRMTPVEGNRCSFEWDVYCQPRALLKPFSPLLRLQFGTMFDRATKGLATYVRQKTTVTAA